jgi:transposase
MKAYSTDLRERVILAANQGMPQTEIAKVFAISLSTIKRYWHRNGERPQHCKPSRLKARPSKKLEPLQLDLSQMLAAAPDATLEQHCQTWEHRHGIKVSPSTMSRAIRRLGWTRKKRRWEPPNATRLLATTGESRSALMDANKLVIVDETGSNIGLTPLYAWAERGQRAYGSIPHNRGKNTTRLSALSLSGMGAAMILEGASDTIAFEYYVEHMLAPSLKPGQIVVMDNLSSHTGPKVRQAIEARECQVLFLPAYSPDLSPRRRGLFQTQGFLAPGWGSHP